MPRQQMNSEKSKHFEMDLLVGQTDRIKHIVKQADEEAAKAKIQRAYPKKDVSFLQIKKL